MKFVLLALAVVAVCYGSIFNSKAIGSCVGKCGNSNDLNGCDCNHGCVAEGDCCSDYQAVCFTCTDRCNEAFGDTKPCQCNNGCMRHGNCCADFAEVCNGTTPNGHNCRNRCQEPYDNTKDCQCAEDCEIYMDCCEDFYQLCDLTTLLPKGAATHPPQRNVRP